MHWLLLATMLVGARPHHAPRKAKPAPAPVSPIAVADARFREGLQAEEMSDDAFTLFNRTINATNLDTWRTRRAYAMGKYHDAIVAWPVHWQSHKHLGFLLRDAGGTIEHSKLSLLHLATYLTLKPDDADGRRAKKVMDDALRQVNDYCRSEPQSARGHMWSILANPDNADAIAAFQGLLVSMRQFNRREVFGGFAAAALIKPGMFSEDLTLRLPDHLGAEGLWFQSVDAAGLGEGDITTRELAYETLRAANFVPMYLLVMAHMHNLMDYLDTKGIPYDPRLPQMLIGESVLRLRSCLCNGFGDVRSLKAEYAKYTQLGGVSAHDLFATRDSTKPVPDYLIPGGTMPEPEKDRDAYDTLRNLFPFPWPHGFIWDSGDPKTYPSETQVALMDVVMDQAYRTWTEWSVQYLDATARRLGVHVNDVLTGDYSKLGTGEISAWSDGPLPTIKRVAEQAGEQQNWLVAAAR